MARSAVPDPGSDASGNEVLIVLAAYQGASFLRAQIDSIRGQTYTGWRLLARDDASSDATMEMLRAAAAQDSRVELLHDDGVHLGPAGNFGRLLEEAARRDARYVMLADQDDVWFPDKIARSLAAMVQEEAQAPGVAVLVHSDVCVTDVHLTPRCPALHGSLGSAGIDSLAALLTRNVVTGCTIVVNRPMLRSVLPVPARAVMHDHWIALCAAVIGRARFIPEATLLYRRHPSTVTRTAESGTRFVDILRRLSRGYYLSRRDMTRFRSQVAQFALLYDRFRDHPGSNPQRLRLVRQYHEILSQDTPPWQRLRDLHRLGIPEEPWLRSLLFAARICLLGSVPLQPTAGSLVAAGPSHRQPRVTAEDNAAA